MATLNTDLITPEQAQAGVLHSADLAEQKTVTEVVDSVNKADANELGLAALDTRVTANEDFNAAQGAVNTDVEGRLNGAESNIDAGDLFNKSIIFIGDSKTAGSSGFSRIFGYMMGAGNIVKTNLGYNQGVGGNTIQQVLDRIETIGASMSDIADIDIGTNDVTLDAETAQTFIDKLKVLISYCFSYGAEKIIVHTITLDDNSALDTPLSAAQLQLRIDINNEIKSLDIENVIIESEASEDFSSSDFTDGRHFTVEGAIRKGKLQAEAISKTIQNSYDNGYLSDNLVTNPFLTGAGGSLVGNGNPTGAIADNWTGFAPNVDGVAFSSTDGGIESGYNSITMTVPSQTLVDDGIIGIRQTITIDETVGGEEFAVLIRYKIEAGHQGVQNIEAQFSTYESQEEARTPAAIVTTDEISGYNVAIAKAAIPAGVTSSDVQFDVRLGSGLVGAVVHFDTPVIVRTEDLSQINSDKISSLVSDTNSGVIFGKTLDLESGTTEEKAQKMLDALIFCRDNDKALDLSGIPEVYLNPDLFTVEHNTSVSIVSTSVFKTKIIAASDGDYLLNMSRNSHIKLNNLYFDCTQNDCGVLEGISDTAENPNEEVLTTDIEHCVIDISNNNKNGIRLFGYKGKCRIVNNKFLGNPSPLLIGEYFDLQTLVTVPDHGEPAGNESLILIDNNEFYDGAVQYATFGTDSPPSPIHIKNNLFVRPFCRAIHIYHGEDAFIAFNTIIDAKGHHASVVDSINAAVWLDQYSPLVEDSREGQVFVGNIVRNFNGNGVFLEETSGEISGWTITDGEEYLDDFEYTGNHGFVTRGGIGMILTGGNRGLKINCRVSGNVQNVVIDHALGVDTKPRIRNVTLSGQFESSRKESILIRNQVEDIKIINASIIKCGSLLDDTYDAIRIERDSGQDGITSLTVKDVNFTDRVQAVTHRHCIGKSYAGMILKAKDNLFDSMSEWVDSGGTVTGIVAENECLNSRGFTLSGTDRWYYNNEGFRSEVSDRITMDAANGLVEWSYDNLDAGSAARVHATVVNATTPMVCVANRFTQRVQFRVFDINGNAVDGTTTPVQLSVVAVSGQSSLL